MHGASLPVQRNSLPDACRIKVIIINVGVDVQLLVSRQLLNTYIPGCYIAVAVYCLSAEIVTSKKGIVTRIRPGQRANGAISWLSYKTYWQNDQPPPRYFPTPSLIS